MSAVSRPRVHQQGRHAGARTVLGGTLMFPAASAGDVVGFWRDFVASAPSGVCSGIAFAPAPHEPRVPTPVRGKPVVVVVLYFDGDLDAGRQALGPMLELGPPVVNTVRPIPIGTAAGLLDEVVAC